MKSINFAGALAWWWTLTQFSVHQHDSINNSFGAAYVVTFLAFPVPESVLVCEVEL